MAQKGCLNRLSDMMIERKNRPNQMVYFIRISSYNCEIDSFLNQCVDRAKSFGVLIDNRLPAPDVNQNSYYMEMMGDDFEFKPSFINHKFDRWMPGLSDEVKRSLSDAMFRMLTELYQSGKNVNVLKNVFIKYMCWLYYRFSQILKMLKPESAPLIVYDAEPGLYELQMLSILCFAGCDVVLIQTTGDDSYLKIDAESRYSQKYVPADAHPFPSHYNLKFLIKQHLAPKTPVQPPKDVQRHPENSPQQKPAASVDVHPKNTSIVPNQLPGQQANSRPVSSQNRVKPAFDANSNARKESPKPVPSPRPLDFGPEPKCKIVTNQWCVSPNPIKSILTPFAIRSGHPGEICNTFHLIQGVENTATFENDLYQFSQQMKDAKRHLVIVESGLAAPTPDAIIRFNVAITVSLRIWSNLFP